MVKKLPEINLEAVQKLEAANAEEIADAKEVIQLIGDIFKNVDEELVNEFLSRGELRKFILSNGLVVVYSIKILDYVG